LKLCLPRFETVSEFSYGIPPGIFDDDDEGKREEGGGFGSRLGRQRWLMRHHEVSRFCQHRVFVDSESENSSDEELVEPRPEDMKSMRRKMLLRRSQATRVLGGNPRNLLKEDNVNTRLSKRSTTEVDDAVSSSESEGTRASKRFRKLRANAIVESMDVSE